MAKILAWLHGLKKIPRYIVCSLLFVLFVPAFIVGILAIVEHAIRASIPDQPARSASDARDTALAESTGAASQRVNDANAKVNSDTGIMDNVVKAGLGVVSSSSGLVDESQKLIDEAKRSLEGTF